jgi:hypothetical protein
MRCYCAMPCHAMPWWFSSGRKPPCDADMLPRRCGMAARCILLLALGTLLLSSSSASRVLLQTPAPSPSPLITAQTISDALAALAADPPAAASTVATCESSPTHMSIQKVLHPCALTCAHPP